MISAEVKPMNELSAGIFEEKGPASIDIAIKARF
jgi:hypothetical protein